MISLNLTAFRIQNYRSIKDTGWKNLAHDNITILIGQNESGKTSVLEALQTFYDNDLNEDVLRSDNSLPVISCQFHINESNNLGKLFDKSKIQPKLFSLIESHTDFILTRIWDSGKISRLLFDTSVVTTFFNQSSQKRQEIENDTNTEIEKLIKASEILFKILEKAERDKIAAETELTNQKHSVEEGHKKLRKSRNPDTRLLAEKDVQIAQNHYDNIEKQVSECIENFEKTKAEIQELSEKLSIGKAYHDSIQKLQEYTQSLSFSAKRLTDIEHLLEINSNVKEKKSLQTKYSQESEEYNRLNQLCNQTAELSTIQQIMANKIILGNQRYKQAESEAIQELAEQRMYLDAAGMGQQLLRFLPDFEFFEDFSGLLPNKIDLEDIINENKQTEGYKAARNFLNIAGLDSSFFREKNHRILKQRIETLNTDVTVNFHDYWSQQVGKDDKIKLHFELEHYDYTVPEKSGKPYLEFWIKDKQERLYPKQRSRGVRWFLSFYLELKAAAARNITNRILLIDEPGLSLHARAQEDVLKVFEDLKQDMQIIYCTHSPHLVKPDKLYRILAVQRANEDDYNSESVILDSSELSTASADTLSPVYALMGIRLTDQSFIRREKNVVVPDQLSYYYLSNLAKLIPEYNDLTFVPATNQQSLPLLVNILNSWQIKFGVLLFGSESTTVIDELKQNCIPASCQAIANLTDFETIEDLFSPIDFKKYILQQRIGITEKNSEFIAVNKLSRNILAANFVNNFNEKKIQFSDLDELTRENLKRVFATINDVLTT